MSKAYVRTTRDIWIFEVNYGFGWEYETTETTRETMRTNRRLYRENCRYPLRIIRTRERLADLSQYERDQLSGSPAGGGL